MKSIAKQCECKTKKPSQVSPFVFPPQLADLFCPTRFLNFLSLELKILLRRLTHLFHAQKTGEGFLVLSSHCFIMKISRKQPSCEAVKAFFGK